MGYGLWVRPKRDVTSSRVAPVIATTFERLLRPATKRTAGRGRQSSSAIKRTKASFAESSTGGAVSRIRTASPCKPTTSVREARG